MTIESELVSNPNGRVALTSASTGTVRVGVLPQTTAANVNYLTASQGVAVKLTPGVVIAVIPGDTVGTFNVYGGHSNGKAYKATLSPPALPSSESMLVYSSTAGGMTTNP